MCSPVLTWSPQVGALEDFAEATLAQLDGLGGVAVVFAAFAVVRHAVFAACL